MEGKQEMEEEQFSQQKKQLFFYVYTPTKDVVASVISIYQPQWRSK